MREKKLTIIVVALVCLGLLTYLVVYTVRADQVAAHYRFGKILRVVRPTLAIDQNRARKVDFGDVDIEVVNEPGLFFKLPWPFDRVVDYDQRIRYVDGKLTQAQLSDGNHVIPRVYATWRILDPVAFQRSLKGDEEVAASRLENIVTNKTTDLLGNYTLGDLVNTDPSRLHFDELEDQIFTGVQSELQQMENSYGIELCSLGVTWIALPEDTTQAVFARMQKERQSVAEALIAEGQRIKREKIAEARLESDKIVAQAEAEAKGVRAQAESEAAQYYETFAKNEHLAIFLRRLEALREITASASSNQKPLTLVVSTKTEPFSILDTGPQPQKQLVSPQIPFDRGSGPELSQSENKLPKEE